MGGKTYQAVVGKIVQGRHGPYVVAHHKEHGTITFSMAKEVWREEKNPEPGTYVVLSDLQKKKAGWRAGNARLLRPEDQQPEVPSGRKGSK